MKPGASQPAAKRKTNIYLGGGGLLLLGCLGCLAFSFLYALTPAGRAGATERAVERTASAEPTQAPAGTATARPANTTAPTEPLPIATWTANPTHTPAATRVPATETETAPPSISPTRPPTVTPRPAATQPPPATSAATQPPAATQAPTLSSTQPLPTATQAPAGITLVSLTSPINAGADASLVIQASPGVNCFLSYVTPSGTTSTAQGLGATTANAEGRCGWTWRIGSSTNPGTGTLFVSAGGANVTYSIVIQ